MSVLVGYGQLPAQRIRRCRSKGDIHYKKPLSLKGRPDTLLLLQLLSYIRLYMVIIRHVNACVSNSAQKN